MTAASRLGVTISVLVLAMTAPVVAAEKWQGKRYATKSTSNGVSCNPTHIVLTKNGSKLRGNLTYNRAVLTGTISSGTVTMTGSSGQWRYIFEGTATGPTMKGTWREQRSGCGGTWDARRQ